MQIFITFCILFISFSSIAQTIILNNETEKPIEFAAIYNSSLLVGTYSDQDGSFKIQTKPNDTLIISCIGYYTDTIICKETLSKKLFLKPKAYDIDEVTISVNVKTKLYELGYRKEKEKISFFSHMGSEWVVYIENNNPERKKLIESVILKTSSKPKDNIVYRIHIYEKDSVTGLPGDDIVNLPLYQSKYHKGRKYELNNHVVLPESGVFVGIEWISYLNKDEKKFETTGNLALSIPISFELENSCTYYRSKFYDNKWILADKNHPLSQLQNATNPPNLGLSIVVKEFLNE